MVLYSCSITAFGALQQDKRRWFAIVHRHTHTRSLVNERRRGEGQSGISRHWFVCVCVWERRQRKQITYFGQTKDEWTNKNKTGRKLKRKWMVQQTDTVKADRIQAMICHLNMMKGHDERNALWHFNARWSFLCLRVTCTPSSDFWLCVRSFFSLSSVAHSFRYCFTSLPFVTGFTLHGALSLSFTLCTFAPTFVLCSLFAALLHVVILKRINLFWK